MALALLRHLPQKIFLDPHFPTTVNLAVLVDIDACLDHDHYPEPSMTPVFSTIGSSTLANDRKWLLQTSADDTPQRLFISFDVRSTLQVMRSGSL